MVPSCRKAIEFPSKRDPAATAVTNTETARPFSWVEILPPSWREPVLSTRVAEYEPPASLVGGGWKVTLTPISWLGGKMVPAGGPAIAQSLPKESADRYFTSRFPTTMNTSVRVWFSTLSAGFVLNEVFPETKVREP